LRYILIILLITSCSSVEKIPDKPEPEIKTKKFILKSKINFNKIDCAKGNSFFIEKDKIKKLTIRYKLSSNSSYVNNKVMESIWGRSIEKSLIRGGLIINYFHKKDDFLIEEDKEKLYNNKNPILIIDRIVLKKIDDKFFYKMNSVDTLRQKYLFDYYIAELNGKIVMPDNSIIWSCNILGSSFDLLKRKNIIPYLLITSKLFCRYSDRLKKWYSDKWVVNYKSILKDQISDKINKQNHINELINYIVNKFLINLSAGK
jgi:hypothetical protein